MCYHIGHARQIDRDMCQSDDDSLSNIDVTDEPLVPRLPKHLAVFRFEAFARYYCNV